MCYWQRKSANFCDIINHMEINALEVNGIVIAELVPNGIEISKEQDAVDLMGNCYSLKTQKIIIYEESIVPNFFDLKTRVAGGILQKFAQYRFSIAIVGDFSKFTSNALKDFIYESNKMGVINFVSSSDEAKNKLSVR
jgi:hypothetical protein